MEDGIPVSVKITERGRRLIERQFAEQDDDCMHDGAEAEEQIGGILFGYCPTCEKPVQMTGPEDEEGQPSWEVCE